MTHLYPHLAPTALLQWRPSTKFLDHAESNCVVGRGRHHLQQLVEQGLAAVKSVVQVNLFAQVDLESSRPNTRLQLANS